MTSTKLRSPRSRAADAVSDRRAARRAVVAATWLLVAGWALGAAVGDRGRVSAVLSHLPAPAVAVAALFAAAVAAVDGRRRAALGLALAATLPLYVVVAVDNQWRRPPLSASVPDAGAVELRVLHWNVFRGGLGWEGPRRRIAAARPDVVVLSEPPEGLPRAALAADLAADLGALAVAGHASLAVFCRGDDRARRVAHGGGEDHEWIVVDCRIDGMRLRVLAADVAADPLRSRALPLAAVRQAIDRHRPDLVLGDFNTPRRSQHLAPPAGYTHCYRSAGAGWSYTWPVPLPVLAIDQCLHGERVVPRRYELGSARWSDHRLQLLDLAIVD